VSLLHPGPGDFQDRLAILSMKIGAGKARSLNVSHLEAEQHEIGERLSPFLDSPHWLRWTCALAEINGRIWDITDEVRFLEAAAHKDGNLRQAGELAREALRLNWRRACIVQEINEAFGASAGWEKLP